MLVSAERKLTLEVIRAMTERQPTRVGCLDAGSGVNHQLKDSAVQTVKTKGAKSFRRMRGDGPSSL
jgi:hypothetical protein